MKDVVKPEVISEIKLEDNATRFLSYACEKNPQFVTTSAELVSVLAEEIGEVAQEIQKAKIISSKEHKDRYFFNKYSSDKVISELYDVLSVYIRAYRMFCDVRVDVNIGEIMNMACEMTSYDLMCSFRNVKSADRKDFITENLVIAESRLMDAILRSEKLDYAILFGISMTVEQILSFDLLTAE